MKMILKILLVLVPPVILAWPFSDSRLPFPGKTYIYLNSAGNVGFDSSVNENVKAQKIQASEVPKVLNIAGRGRQIISQDLFSRIFKIDIQSMPIDLCLENKNSIIDEDCNKIHISKTPNAEQVGAMYFKYNSLADGGEKGVYLKLGEQNCDLLPAEGVNFLLSFEIRTSIPTDAGLNNDLVYFMIGPQLGHYNVHWKWSVFLTNLFLLISGWWVLLASSLAIKDFIFKRN